MPEGKEWSPEFVIYGDLGRKGGAPSIRALKQEAHTGRYTAFIHTGDFAYNFHDEDGQRGDNFMRRIQDIAARVPYMTCPGNHEIWYDFSHYRYRFSAPRSDWPIQKWQMWYSFDVANIHFISYSSEVYFTDDELYAPAQIKWLEKDLTEANSPSNRTQRPWIIVFGHRPMYCSNLNRDDCTTPLSKVRIGLEDTFYKYGVDLIIEAHEHSYERLYPVFHGQVTNCDYKNPRAPAHIIGGAAGCNEQFGLCADVVLSPRGPWSAFRSWLPGLNGYGRLKVFNNTHLYYEQMLAMTGQVMDRFWLVQTNHGPYNETFNPDTEHCSSN
ncbi:unnamed protein product [Owenia fusiformis]|uniref:Uncharacterized protein n=1 Tax=Owenia fusiformis TaxID=6347 RepID=A0A8J1TUN9_OWEFU|nr:unnamed protein product [Owenia fusiformis]